MKATALLFDLDGTLVDSRHDLAESVRWIQSHYGIATSDDLTVGRYIGDGVAKLVGRALGSEEEPRLSEAVELFKSHYRDHCLDTTRLYEGVRDVLDFYRDLPKAVVTNKPERITHRILKGLKLADDFPVVLGGDSVKHKKPHPEAIFVALEKLSIPGKEGVWMIGDSATDIVAGKAAGVKTCGIYSNIGNHAALLNAMPHYIGHDLRDLMRFIDPK
jgi:phosphoglycolate phosphatase